VKSRLAEQLAQELLGLGRRVGHQRTDLVEQRDLLGREPRLDLGVDAVAADELALEDWIVPDRKHIGPLLGARAEHQDGGGESDRRAAADGGTEGVVHDP
jgi:hypothetical protein